MSEQSLSATAKLQNATAHKGVWVYIEQSEGVIEGVSLELLGAGRQLADKLDVPLAGVLLGDNVKPLCEQLIAYGADEVYLMEHPLLKDYRTEPYLKGVYDFSMKYKPEIFLFGATPNGKDISSAVATDLATGLTADTTMLDIDIENRLFEASRPAFGGNIMATILCKERRPQMATVRPKVMKALEPDTSRKGKIIELPFVMKAEDIRTKVIEIVRDATNQKSLADADIVVSIGKGVADEKGVQMANQLAETIGGTVGGTRDVVELGLLPHSLQIGQTGETVTPKIFISIASSGAIQHVVGMKNSDMIIAINNNEKAPIFDVATYSIVGDAYEIVPMLTESFKANAAKWKKEV